MPTSHISLEKTEHIIGTKVDISVDAEDSDDEEDTSANAGKPRAVRYHDSTSPSSPMEIREMREVLSAQATSYIELEKLVVALDTLQTWRLIVDEKIQLVVPRVWRFPILT
jgi:hypothetical protein